MARARVVLPVLVWLVCGYDGLNGVVNGYRSLGCLRWLRGIGSLVGAPRPCLQPRVSCDSVLR